MKSILHFDNFTAWIFFVVNKSLESCVLVPQRPTIVRRMEVEEGTTFLLVEHVRILGNFHVILIP